MTLEVLKKANDLAIKIESLKSRIDRFKVLHHRVKINGLDFTGFAFREHYSTCSFVSPIDIDKEQALELIEIAIDMADEKLRKLEKEFKNL